jgi:hypothetical protein
MKVKAPAIVRYNGFIETYKPHNTIFTGQELKDAVGPNAKRIHEDKEYAYYGDPDATEPNQMSKDICGKELPGDLLMIPLEMLPDEPKKKPSTSKKKDKDEDDE